MISVILALLLSPLNAETPALPDAGSLSSSNASYDGNALLLTGRVVLDHGLGKMMAEEASLQRQEAGKDFPFSLIQLRKEVEVALKNNARIVCDNADLDFTSLKGRLTSAENGKVVYSDHLKKKKGSEEIPLQLSSKTIDLNFLKQLHDGKKTDYEIEAIFANNDVIIEYGREIQLIADRAIYRRELPRDNKGASKEFQGVITAYPKDEKSHCRLLHGADAIDAAMIDLNLIQSKITLLRPRGKIASAFLQRTQNSSLQFESDHLYWDQIKNILTLKGHVRVQEEIMGKLHAEEELNIVQTTLNGQTVIKSISATGPATLLYNDSSDTSHKLISQGVILLDRDQLRATVESPQEKGIVPEKKQLYYEEKEIAVFADRAQVEYALSDKTLQPSSLTLNGNIRLFSHDPNLPPRCGVADRLTYSMTTRTLILSADPGKKVLFWDEAQGLHLSAPEVHITYDPETKEQSVKGIGKVQFAFTPEESSKFQQIFPQHNPRP